MNTYALHLAKYTVYIMNVHLPVPFPSSHNLSTTAEDLPIYVHHNILT